MHSLIKIIYVYYLKAMQYQFILNLIKFNIILNIIVKNYYKLESINIWSFVKTNMK